MLAKVVCLLWYLRAPIPPLLRRFVATCPASPPCVALVDRRKFMTELFYHDTTPAEDVWSLLWQGVFHDCVMLPVSLFFSLEFREIGL